MDNEPDSLTFEQFVARLSEWADATIISAFYSEIWAHYLARASVMDTVISLALLVPTDLVDQPE